MFIYRYFLAFIRYSGLTFLIRNLVARNRVSIIVYHNPKAKTFEEHLHYLANRYNIISLSDLSMAIYSNNWQKIPRYALIITFDDGWKENYELLGTIKKYKFRPTIFLTSHLINTERNFWFNCCSSEDKKRYKRIANSQRLQELKDKYGFHQEKEFLGSRQVLNLIEIERMKEFVEFGIHTCFHPVLTKCTASEKRTEISECKKRIEGLLGEKVETFAYPNGNYDNECKEILIENNIRIARTIDVGWNSKKTDSLKLKILGVSDNGSVTKLSAEMTGISLLVQRLIL